MGHRHLPEGLDRTLRDIRDDERLFGGIVVVVSGDFRELPVAPAARAASRRREPRACCGGTSADAVDRNMYWRERRRDAARAVLEKIGDGASGAEEFGAPDERGRRRCRFPGRLCVEGGVDRLIDFVFPGLADGGPITGDNAVLASTNTVVDDINAPVTARFPGGEAVRLLSSDALSRDDAERNNVPVEILNDQTPAGLPPHELKIKGGMPLMLAAKSRPHQRDV